MLHLKTGVHLEEGDGAVHAHEELAGAGPVVAGLFDDRLGGSVELLDLVVAQEWGGSLFDQFLVAPLQRAVACGHNHDVAVLVGQDLGLDVAGMVQVALHEALPAAEGRDGLSHRGVVQLRDLLEAAGDLQPAATATEGRLDGDGKTVLLGEGHDLVGVLDRVRGALDLWCAGTLGDVAGGDLVAEVPDRLGRGTDPGQARVDHSLGEVRVLGQEPVTGVDRVSAGLVGRGDDLVHHQVRLSRGRPAQSEGLVGLFDVQSVTVGLGINRYRGDARVLARARHSDSDLTTVGNQYLTHGSRVPSAGHCSCRSIAEQAVFFVSGRRGRRGAGLR